MSEESGQAIAQQTALTDDEQERWKELADVPPGDLSDKEATAKAKLSLRRRYGDGAWTLVFEFTGPNGRRADAFAVSRTKSNNFQIVAFEIKASRSDWLSEKKDPKKQEHFVGIADEFYVVAARKGIVNDSELPEGWGLLELKPNSERLYKEVESDLTENQAGTPSRRFWAKLIQKIDDGSRDGYTDADLAEARSRGYDEAKNDEYLADRSDRELERLQEKADAFDDIRKSDIPISSYRASDDQLQKLEVAHKIVSEFEDDGYGSMAKTLERMQDTVKRRATDALETLEELREEVDALQDKEVSTNAD